MRGVWIAGGAAVALFAGLAVFLAPLEPGVLALQFAFTPRAFGRVVHAWPADHLARYRAHLPVDMLLLAAYATFGYLLATRSRLFAGAPRWWRRAGTWALPLAAVCDAVENALHWWLTEVPRFGVPLPYAAAGAAATAKWLLVFGWAILVLGSLVRHGEGRRAGPQRGG